MRIKKNLISGLMISVVCMTCFSGCQKLQRIEIEEEKEDLLVEYAANAVLKNDKRFNNKALQSESTTPRQTTTYVVETAKQEETTTVAKQNGSNSGSSASDNQETAKLTLNQLFSLNGIKVTYLGKSVTDSYPKDDSNTMSGVTAADGKKLVVLRFKLKNTTDKAKTVNMLEKKLNYQLQLNGDEAQYARIPALLLDSLNTFHGEIKAGKSKELVLIYEFNKKSTKDISKMELTISGGANDGTIELE